MSWHYQVIRDKNGMLGIHEYYPDIDGSPAWTMNPIDMQAETIEDLEWMLETMLEDLYKYDIIGDTLEDK